MAGTRRVHGAAVLCKQGNSIFVCGCANANRENNDLRISTAKHHLLGQSENSQNAS